MHTQPFTLEPFKPDGPSNLQRSLPDFRLTLAKKVAVSPPNAADKLPASNFVWRAQNTKYNEYPIPILNYTTAFTIAANSLLHKHTHTQLAQLSKYLPSILTTDIHRPNSNASDI